MASPRGFAGSSNAGSSEVGSPTICLSVGEGETLTELIPKKSLPLNKFFEVAIPLTDAVSAAHEQGIIHRDLKADNLMQNDEGLLSGPRVSWSCHRFLEHAGNQVAAMRRGV